MKHNALIKKGLQKLVILTSLMIFNLNAFAQPANDCIFNAIDITPVINGISQSNAFDCTPYTYSSALSQPTRDNVNGNNTACDNGPDFRDVWFTFTVTATTPPTWVDVYQQGIDVVTALYSGTPAGTCGPGGNITGLTYIDCSDNGLGGALDVATCTTPLHSRIDISSLPNGTYYYRVWEWNGGTPSNATYNLCVEHAGGDGVTSDECPGGPTIALTSCPNVSVSETYTNLSNAGMMGNACNTNTNEPQLATGAAGNYQDNCTGTLWTGIGYINNVMNNSAIYGFEINATPGCEPNVSITFDNMQYGGTPGNVAQIQVVNAPCAGGSGAVMLGTTNDPCFYMEPTTGTLPSGQYFIVVDGQDGQLIQYDLTIDITYSTACESNVPTADFTASSPVCTGSSSTITYTGNGNAGHTYNWGFDGGTINSGSGSGPYQVSWNAPGTYEVTLETSDGTCSNYDTMQVIVSDGPTIIVTPSDASCNGASDGSAVANAAGGTAPYTYSWNTTPAQTTATANGLAAGNYTVTITDNNGCQSTANTTINEPTAITIATSTVDANCGQPDGSATANPSGGTAPYTYSWNTTPVQTTATASALAAGNYTVTVTDNNGCTQTANVTINDLPGVVASIASTTDASCNGASDGSAVANAAGGTAPYTYSWNTTPVQTTATVTGLPAGNYTVTITDNNGCQSTANTTINEPTAITIATSTVDANCGQPDGSATANPNGGTAPYTYSWNTTPVQTAATASALAAGNYTVTVTDNNGCIQTANVTINDLPGVVASIASTTDASCNAASDGSAVANAAGGTAPYTYSWNTTPVQTTATATGLAAGNYTVTITDNNGCQSTANTTINEPTAITIATSTVDANCGQPDGSATANPSGGAAPYTYSWNTTPVQNTATATNLAAGTYNVTVTDNNGCTQTASVNINNLGAPTVNITNTTDVSCNAGNDGDATANAAGGTAPYTYSWNTTPVQTAATASGLSAGTYTVTVTDNNGCQASANATINEPNTIAASINTNDASCNGANDGDATVAANGGTAPYTYSWNTTPVQTTATANGLAAGNYTVTITDNNGCQSTANTTINEPTAINLAISTMNANCGNNDGSATVTASGGNGSFTYSWNTNPIQTTATATQLFAGNYTVTVTDANGCQEMANAIVGNTSGFTVSISNVSHVTCNGANNGSATANTNGGVAPFTYQWNSNPNQFSQTISNVGSGLYIVTVTDANGCTAVDSVNINEPSAINNSTPTTVDICYGQSALLNSAPVGGTPNYNFEWSNGSNAQNINVAPTTNTSYWVIVTDANNCTADTNFINVNVSDPLQTTIIDDSLTICEGNSITINSNTTGGQPANYTYAWNPGNSNNESLTTNPIISGWYVIEVSDGCSVPNGSDSIYTEVEQAPSGMFNLENLQGCSPVCVDLAGTDGSNYVYDWELGDGTFITGESFQYCYETPGTYDITLTVSNGGNCSATSTIVSAVTVYDNPIADFISDDIEISITDGSINFDNYSSGFENFLWNFGDNQLDSTSNSPTHIYENAGEYWVSLFVSNEYGCTDSIQRLIKITEDANIFVPNAFTPNDDGHNDLFGPVAIGLSEDDYRFTIYDRWGQIVFETTQPNHFWDGRGKDSNYVKSDVYVWQLKARPDGTTDTQILTGHVTLTH